MISSQQLGERLADARKRAKLTQAQLADKLGVARTTLVAIEKGERRPANAELVKLAYDLPAGTQLPAVRPFDAPIRVVKEVGDFFGTLPPAIDEFDHYRPAEFLLQQGAAFTLPELDFALQRFESLFRDLNAMLA